MEARLEELRAAAMSGARLAYKRSRSPSSPGPGSASRSGTPASRSRSPSPARGSPPRVRRKVSDPAADTGHGRDVKALEHGRHGDEDGRDGRPDKGGSDERISRRKSRARAVDPDGSSVRDELSDDDRSPPGGRSGDDMDHDDAHGARGYRSGHGRRRQWERDDDIDRDRKYGRDRDMDDERDRGSRRDRPSGSDRDGYYSRRRESRRPREYSRYDEREDERERERERERGRERSDRDYESRRDRYRREDRYARRDDKYDDDRGVDRDRRGYRDRGSRRSPPREYQGRKVVEDYGWRKHGRVRPRRGDRVRDCAGDDRDSRTVFVWQLAQKVRQDDVYDVFSRAGRVRDVRLIMDRRSGRHKGQGYVEFHDSSALPDALKLNGSSILGYPVAVKCIQSVAGSGGCGLVTPLDNAQPPLPPGVPSGRKDEAIASGKRVSSADVDPPRLIGTPSGGSGPSSGGRGGIGPFSEPAGQLVSIEELRKLLNPGNVPLAPVPVSGYGTGSAGTQGGAATPMARVQLPEALQVPLPIPGQKIAPKSATGLNPASTLFTRLYVGSIPFTVTEEDLMSIFKPFGDISSLQLQRESGTGRSRGYGFVEYVQHESAKKALDLNGITLAGRSLKVNLASSTGGLGISGGNTAVALASSAAASISAAVADGARNQINPLDGEQAGELDEGRDGGVALNASQRAQLMQRLSRGEDMGTLPTATGGPKMNPPCATTDSETRCLLLSNMFDPIKEASLNPKFDEEVADEVKEEVTEKYGKVDHIFVDKSSNGLVYIVFGDVGSSCRAKAVLHGRWFGGKCIAAAYVDEAVYKQRLPDAPLEI